MNSTRPLPILAALGVILLLPSLAVLQRYGGGPGILLYIGILAAILVGGRYLLITRGRHVTRRRVHMCLAAIAALLLVTTTLGYPLANSGRFGAGSDRDEALTVAATRLVRGEAPYALPTYLGNPISPLPGAVLLAVPFALLGAVALQTPVWLLLAGGTIYATLPVSAGRVLLWIGLFLLSPAFWRDLLTGSDLPTNGLYVLVALLLTVATAHLGSRGWLVACLLGITLASRANFLLLLPLLYRPLVTRSDPRQAGTVLLLAGLSAAAVTIPFWLADPAGFTPLRTATEVTVLNRVVPWSGQAILLASALLSLVLAWWQDGTWQRLLVAAATVLLVPVVAGVLIVLLWMQQLWVSYASFAVLALPVAILAILVLIPTPTVAPARRQAILPGT